MRNYIDFKVLSCQDEARSCISRAGFKESRSRNKRSKGPSSIGFEGPGGKPRALGCSKQQWVTAATLHCHNLPQHPEERAGQHRWEDVQAWKRDLKGWGEAPEEGKPRRHIHHGLHFDLSVISLLKIVQGWQGRSWQWCRKPLPSPCLLACKPLQAARFSGPLQWLQNNAEKSATEQDPGFCKSRPCSALESCTPPSHGEANN